MVDTIRSRIPPGPQPRYPGELLLAMQRDTSAFLTRLARQYGDAVSFRIGTYRLVLLNHPHLIREVLVTQQRNFIKGIGQRQAKLIVGEGLVTSEGEFHLRQRRRIQPLFHRQHLAAYGDRIAEQITHACQDWQGGETREITREMWDLTLNIIARTLLNADVQAEADEINRTLADLLRFFNPAVLFLVNRLKRVPGPLASRYALARARFEDKIYRNGGETSDLVKLLRSPHPAGGDGGPADEQQVRDEMLTLFLAGVGATADMLSRTFYLLSQCPEVEERLRAEIDSVVGGTVTVADLDRLIYARQVLTESMRLYPPNWTIDREPLADCEIGGCLIPAGSTVLLSQWVMHRDPRFYPDPLRFDPDRWDPEHKPRNPEFAYFPFGGGLRICIGEPLAWMIGLMALAIIVPRWRLRLAPKHRVDLRPHLGWSPNERIYMTLEKVGR
jgi:cytochrome P450